LKAQKKNILYSFQKGAIDDPTSFVKALQQTPASQVLQ